MSTTLTSSTLVTVQDLSFTYYSNIRKKESNAILERLNFKITEKDFIALIGPNGAGKTTLIKIILGFLTPTSGKCLLNVSQEKISYIPQRYYIAKNFPGTVKEILSAGHIQFPQPSEPDKEEIENLYQEMGIPDIAEKQFINLSGGQQQKALIALAVLRYPQLLILDEPTSGLDQANRQWFYCLLQKLNQRGVAIVLVTHEMSLISSLVKKVIYIDRCQYHEGKPEELKKNLTAPYNFNTNSINPKLSSNTLNP